MRSSRPLLLVVLALAAVGAYLALDPGAPAGGGEAVDLRDGAPAPAPDTLDGVRLTGNRTGERARPEPVGPGSVLIDPRTIPRGPISVAVLGPDDAPVPAHEVSVHVAPGRGSRDWHTTPLLHVEPGSHVWRSEDVFAGPVAVTVSGEHVVTKVVETRVIVGTPNDLVVHVDRAGAITYAVRLFSGDEPEKVTLTLLDAARKPVAAQYQVRTETVLTQPRLVTTITQGPTGVLFGVPPGRYTLRAVSPSEEYDEAAVEVTAGSSVEARLSIRQ